MSLINNAMNAIGTLAALKSLFGAKPSNEASGKLNQFISEIKKSGVARTNLFEVVISAPRILTGKTDVAQKISLYAQSTSLPGLFLQTSEVKRYGVGPTEKIPYSMATNNISLQLIGDGKGEIYKFFYNWLQGIVYGDGDVPTGATKNGMDPYEVEYKDQYATTMDIITYDENANKILQYTLTDIFPVNIADVALNWSDSSSMQISVQFEFLQSRLITANDIDSGSPSNIQGLSAFQKAIKIATAVQAIASLRKPTGIQDALSSATTVKNIFR